MEKYSAGAPSATTDKGNGLLLMTQNVDGFRQDRPKFGGGRGGYRQGNPRHTSALLAQQSDPENQVPPDGDAATSQDCNQQMATQAHNARVNLADGIDNC